MALGSASVVEEQFLSVRTFEWFVAFSMCGLGYLKLRDVESFSLMFLNYDLLARRDATSATATSTPMPRQAPAC